MNEIVKPFDRYRVHYGTINPAGRDLTLIEFFDKQSKVGQILSGAAIGVDALVSLQRDSINLYFDSAMLANALAILQGESDLALYLVPDPENPTQGREGGICTGVVQFGGAAPVATAQAGLKASVEFDTPTPQDGSFNYRVIKTTGGLDSRAELDGQPSVVGNRTTLTVKGLTAGTKYTFKVTATRSTTGAFATSLSSNEITAIA